MVKVCLITCYNQPDYVRARTLRAAFGEMNEVELIVVKNTYTDLRRYPEVFWKVFVTRLKRHPDVYFQTFRAYDSFPFLRLITIGKTFIFDEFINPIEHIAYENHRINPEGLVAKIARLGYKLWLFTVQLIVTDTPSHAQYSAELMKIPMNRYAPLIVSSDEGTFKPRQRPRKKEGDPFTVFFYGLFMMPLQGLGVMLEAMKLLKGHNIKLILIGGKEKTIDKVAVAQKAGAKVDYQYRVPYEELAKYMNIADVCLGGPLGRTVQSQYVIGGKTYQYLQMGRPVIIGHNEESHRWTDKKNALIVEQANPQALADAILWAKDHPAELEKIAVAGRKLYEDTLSNKVLVQELRSLLADKHIL